MERVIRRQARAKINVYLRVLGRRDDGYHDLDSLILPVSLADELTVRLDPELRLSVAGPLADAVALDESNLVIRAARAAASACGTEAGADIELTKRIPVAAGLGGGSADAAATILALRELWGCELSAGILEVAAAVGSDVPALIAGGPVVVRGRGEVAWVQLVPPTSWVLVPQDFGVSTADAYAWWDEEGERSSPVAPGELGDARAMAAALHNDLERPVMARHPEIDRAKRRLLDRGALGAVMCGSGPTVAGLATSEADAVRISEAIPGSIAVSAPA